MKQFASLFLASIFISSAVIAQNDSFGSKATGSSSATHSSPPTEPVTQPATPPIVEPTKSLEQGDAATPLANPSAQEPSGVGAFVTPLDPQPTGPLPTTDDIFAKSISAIGGADAIRKHTSMLTKGTLSMPSAGMSGKLEIITLAPNKILTSMEFPGVGQIQQGFDGTVGWSNNPMQGPSLIQGTMLEEMKRSSDMYKDIDPAKIWSKSSVKGAVNFAGVPCYELAVEGAPGNGTLYFEIQSGLTRGMALTVESAMGKVPTTTVMSEYKDFDGVKMATRTEVEAMGMKQTLIVDTVSFAAIDPKLFNLPPAIRALVAAEKKPSAKGAAGKTP